MCKISDIKKYKFRGSRYAMLSLWRLYLAPWPFSLGRLALYIPANRTGNGPGTVPVHLPQV